MPLRKIMDVCLCVLLAMQALPVPARAQQPPLTLDDCYGLARQNYPLVKKHELIIRSSRYTLDNISKQFYPQFSVTGQASYQSETISFPAALGGSSGQALPSISKDQYRLQADISQQIYDGGANSAQRKLARSATDLQQQSLEINLYQLRERINQLYFAILYIDEQVKQFETRRDNLQQVTEKVTAAFDNGTAFKSNVDELKAETATLDMQRIELDASRIAYIEMLGMMTGIGTDSTLRLAIPVNTVVDAVIKRPELNLFTFQKQNLGLREQQLKSDYLPRISAFVQTAYGRPTLNIIKNQFGPWFIGGIRLNWNFGSLYTLKNNRLLLQNDQLAVDAEQETFLFNTRLTLSQQQGDTKKYRQLIDQDDKAIELRTSVKNAAQAQLENGVITVHDFIGQLNAETTARQNRLIHTIQLLQAQYNAKTSAGN